MLDSAAAAAKSLQSCPTPSDPMDCSPPGFSASMGFSRQEYWSGVPLPSPMFDSLASNFFPQNLFRKFRIRIPIHKIIFKRQK